MQTVEHGDVFQALGELGTDSAHCAIVDYPWEFDASNGTNRFGSDVEGRTVKDLPYDIESEERITSLVDELARVLVDGSWLVFLADDRFQDRVRDALRDSEFTFRRNWAWTPESMGMGYYGRIDHYPVPVATLGDTERKVTDRPTLFRVPGGRQTDYPTGKPVELYRQILRPPVIEDGEMLLEPFCGSGPGAAVAAERDLDYWGCDIAAGAVEMAGESFNQSRLTQGVF